MFKGRVSDASPQEAIASGRRLADLPSDFKTRLRKHMLSEPFKRAFEGMVEKSIENGTETNFNVSCSVSCGFRLGNGKLIGGNDRNAVDPFSNHEDFYAMFLEAAKLTNDLGFVIMGIHTHPYGNHDFEDLLLLPSPQDCKALSGHNSIGLVVPFNDQNGALEIVAFQNTRFLSYQAYENVVLEMQDRSLEEIDREINRSSVLRLIRFPKRKVARLTAKEIDTILDVMELKFYSA